MDPVPSKSITMVTAEPIWAQSLPGKARRLINPLHGSTPHTLPFLRPPCSLLQQSSTCLNFILCVTLVYCPLTNTHALSPATHPLSVSLRRFNRGNLWGEKPPDLGHQRALWWRDCPRATTTGDSQDNSGVNYTKWPSKDNSCQPKTVLRACVTGFAHDRPPELSLYIR